ncbi:MAG: ferrochelatase [Neisseriaceae bacterium]|nr:MAG: ferrochelatase [Neisseriaceae bacterium]
MTIADLHADNKSSKRYGVLIINIGGPQTLSHQSIKHYLKLFLSDKRVLEINPILWKIILHLFILPIRPRKSLSKYKLIWSSGKYSPLIQNSINLVDKLQKSFNQEVDNITIRMAMNYSDPFVDNIIADFQQDSISNLIVLPLFPQYSAATVGASLDQVWRTLLNLRFQPEISSINYFYQDPMYVEALTQHIEDYWRKNGRSRLLLVSYHGIPIKCVEKGDPYYQHCLETTRIIQQKLKLEDNEILMSFQSRFGKFRWLQPNTQKLLKKLPKNGISSIDVISPSFIVDCLETLEELDISGRKQFIQAGGKVFNYIPCLNDNKVFVEALKNIIRAKL